MQISVVSYENIGKWSLFWKESNTKDKEYFGRSFEEDYFIYKYLKSYHMIGYCIMIEDQVIGFFGVRFSKIQAIDVVEFCDFIFDPNFRGKGYLNKLINYLRENFFKDKQAFIFLPINRAAMITWKFALKPTIIGKLNRWYIKLKQIDSKALEFEYLYDTVYLKETSDIDHLVWCYNKEVHRYYYIINEHIIKGYIILKEIENRYGRGLEVYDLKLREEEGYLVQGVLAQVLDMSKDKYEYIIIKCSENTTCNKYIEEHKALEKYKEVQYQFILCESLNIDELKNYKVIGETLDIPRLNYLSDFK